MAENIKISQKVIHKLHLVQKFITEIYDGKQQYRPRIAFILNTLNDVITELKDNQD